MSSFAERLEEARKEKGCTQKAISDQIGITGAYMSQMSTGKRVPSDRTAKDLAEALGVNVQWLVEGTGPKKPDLSREEAIAEMAAKILQNKPGSFVERVVAALVKADESQIEALENFLEALKKKED